jgi:hypothetical protein
LKTFVRFLAGFSMRALVGDFLEPVPRLRIHVGQLVQLSLFSAPRERDKPAG